VSYPPRRSFFELLLQKQSQDNEVEVEVRLAKYLAVKTPGIRPWLKGGMLGVLPFRLEFK